MNNLFENHRRVIDEILILVEKKFHMRQHSAKVKENEFIDGHVYRFQIEYFNSFSNPMKPGYLNFEIYSESPDILCFEAKSCLMKFDISNQYEGLKSEILASLK